LAETLAYDLEWWMSHIPPKQNQGMFSFPEKMFQIPHIESEKILPTILEVEYLHNVYLRTLALMTMPSWPLLKGLVPLNVPPLQYQLATHLDQRIRQQLLPVSLHRQV
jgi:hypothetical protein